MNWRISVGENIPPPKKNLNTPLSRVLGIVYSVQVYDNYNLKTILDKERSIKIKHVHLKSCFEYINNRVNVKNKCAILLKGFTWDFFC